MRRSLDNLNAEAPPRVARRARFTPIFQSLLVGLVAALLLVAFVSLGGEVLEGDTSVFDGYILRHVQLWRTGHPGFVSAMRDLSGLGSTVVLTVVVLLSVGYLLLVSARTTALLVAASAISATALVSVFKSVFSRVRPDAAFAELVAPGLSFPSGHATMSAAIFLTMGALLASTRSRGQERVYILFAAAVLTVLVGLSRVGLGVHWATDVLAGWAFGSAWAMVWLLVARGSTHRAAAA
jgi:undecaprenyl-diphosphatase